MATSVLYISVPVNSEELLLLQRCEIPNQVDDTICVHLRFQQQSTSEPPYAELQIQTEHDSTLQSIHTLKDLAQHVRLRDQFDQADYSQRVVSVLHRIITTAELPRDSISAYNYIVCRFHTEDASNAPTERKTQFNEFHHGPTSHPDRHHSDDPDSDDDQDDDNVFPIRPQTSDDLPSHAPYKRKSQDLQDEPSCQDDDDDDDDDDSKARIKRPKLMNNSSPNQYPDSAAVNEDDANDELFATDEIVQQRQDSSLQSTSTSPPNMMFLFTLNTNAWALGVQHPFFS